MLWVIKIVQLILRPHLFPYQEIVLNTSCEGICMFIELSC